MPRASLTTSYSILHFRRRVVNCRALVAFVVRPEQDSTRFRPFQSPVPFLFVRQGVISDWKFFLDNDEWLDLWARRFGESAVQALAEELRRLPWNARRD